MPNMPAPTLAGQDNRAGQSAVRRYFKNEIVSQLAPGLSPFAGLGVGLGGQVDAQPSQGPRPPSSGQQKTQVAGQTGMQTLQSAPPGQALPQQNPAQPSVPQGIAGFTPPPTPTAKASYGTKQGALSVGTTEEENAMAGAKAGKSQYATKQATGEEGGTYAGDYTWNPSTGKYEYRDATPSSGGNGPAPYPFTNPNQEYVDTQKGYASKIEEALSQLLGMYDPQVYENQLNAKLGDLTAQQAAAGEALAQQYGAAGLGGSGFQAQDITGLGSKYATMRQGAINESQMNQQEALAQLLRGEISGYGSLADLNSSIAGLEGQGREAALGERELKYSVPFQIMDQQMAGIEDGSLKYAYADAMYAYIASPQYQALSPEDAYASFWNYSNQWLKNNGGTAANLPQ